MLRFSPATFSLVYSLSYISLLWIDAPLFNYYPQTGSWSWGWVALENDGPAMVWYGLMANAFITATIISVVIPDQPITSKLRNFLWVIPVIAMIGCLYLMKTFFIN